MSHELRTPLNAVLGFSEVLLERMFGDINERQEEYLHDIHGSGRHLLELLNEILDLSKIEAGRMDLEYSAFELRSLLEDAAGMLRERATDAGVEPQRRRRRRRRRRALRRAPAQADRAQPDDQRGQVHRRRAARWSSGRADAVPDVEITVTDTGIGVPEADRRADLRVLPAGRAGQLARGGHRPRSHAVQRLVELLGGRMWLESEVGVGSTFGFSIPGRERDGAERRDESGEAHLMGQVVVIEDDRPSLELLMVYLSEMANDITVARDGPSGLETVRRVHPDVVLLDIRLPGIDGWAVLEALKADPDTRDIPVVVVSIVDERARGAALGAAAYLVKPISRDDLLGSPGDGRRSCPVIPTTHETDRPTTGTSA